MSVTKISSCTTTSCAFNNGGCTAFAITVGGDNGAPACDPFISLDARGGLPVAEGHVGACQRLECVHNKDLMCTAEAVTVAVTTASTPWRIVLTITASLYGYAYGWTLRDAETDGGQ